MASPMAELRQSSDLAMPQPSAGDSRLDSLLESTREVFAEKGFDRASMQDLARAAGMSAGNFYRYFPSKDAIIETLVKRELSEIETHFQQVMQATDPLTLLTEMLHDQLNNFDRHDCCIWMEVLVAAPRHPGIARLYDNLMRSIGQYLILAFARVHNMPDPEAERRFGAHAEMIFLLIQGINLNRIRNNGAITDGCLAIAHRTLDLYLTEISHACTSWCGERSQDPVNV